MKSNIKLLYVDLFCGAGGTSTGIELAKINGSKCAKVVACVNHCANAIKSHRANHPDAMHYTEDIRTLDVQPLHECLEKAKLEYSGAKTVLWASLECTNFSKAKGGLPRDPDSRTLAEHLYRYIDILQPDYIMIENVEEFMAWGDLDEHGHPISRDRGRCFLKWIKKVEAYGYYFDYKILNAADFGAYTSRKRFFGQFAKKGVYHAWPSATHRKNGNEGYEIFGDEMFKKWKPVKEVLDMDDDGSSIFNRKKTLCEATLRRIYAGLTKFVDKDHFISKAFSGDERSKNISVDQPAGAITTKDHHFFISVYHKHGYVSSVQNPSPTITTKDRCALIHTKFIDMQYGKGTPTSIDEPAKTILANPKQNIVCCTYLLNPQYNSSGGSVEKPCFTLIARMDKMPPYKVRVRTEGELPDFIFRDGNNYYYSIYPDDNEIMASIKEFMCSHAIIDIRMRMLNIQELKRIMGFPDNYQLVGTKAEQKKFIGNAVEVNMSKCLCEALAESISE